MIMECFVGFISDLFNDNKESIPLTNYWNVTYEVSPKYEKAEAFVNDGRELYMIAMMLEKPEVLPNGVMDNVEDKVLVSEISFNRVLRALFEKHAMTYNIPLKDAIEKWLSKYDKTFGKAAKPIHELLLEIEWEWLEPFPRSMDRS